MTANDGALRLAPVASLAALEPHADALDALALDQPEPSPFTTADYLRELFAAVEDARLTTVWQGGRLVGLLPLARQVRVKGGFRLSRLTFPGTQPTLPCDWLLQRDLHERAPEVLHLLQTRDDWDDALLRSVPAGSPLTALSDGAYVWPHGAACVTRLETEWDALFLRFSGNRRRHIRRIMRLDKFGPSVRARVTAFPDEMEDPDETFGAIEQVLGQTWKAEPTGLRDGTRILLSAARRMVSRRRVVCFALHLDQRPAAFLLLIRLGRHLHAVLNGHLSEADPGSPGAVLIASALKYGCDHKYEALHFGNDRQYLRHWAVDTRPYYTVRLFNRTIRGRALRLLARRSRRDALESAL